VGNWPEVVEAVRCLRGEGPDDLELLCTELAAEMMVLADRNTNPDTARERAGQALHDGSALDRFLQMVEAQGGDPDVLDNPEAQVVHVVEARRDGFVEAVDAREIGLACVAMGAGRARKEDTVDPKAGVTLNKKPGDPVVAGDILALLHGSSADRVRGVADAVRTAFRIGPWMPYTQPLLRDRYANGSWSSRVD